MTASTRLAPVEKLNEAFARITYKEYAMYLGFGCLSWGLALAGFERVAFVFSGVVMATYISALMGGGGR